MQTIGAPVQIAGKFTSPTFFQDHSWEHAGALHLLVNNQTSEVLLRIIQSDIVPNHPLYFFNEVMYTSLPKLKAAIELVILSGMQKAKPTFNFFAMNTFNTGNATDDLMLLTGSVMSATASCARWAEENMDMITAMMFGAAIQRIEEDHITALMPKLVASGAIPASIIREDGEIDDDAANEIIPTFIQEYQKNNVVTPEREEQVRKLAQAIVDDIGAKFRK